MPAANGTIFDRLDAHHIDWAVYYQDAPSPVIVPGTYTPARASRFRHYDAPSRPTCAAGGCRASPSSSPTTARQLRGEPAGHPVRRALPRRRRPHADARATWSKTALFITYDEHGGYYDHVPPPRAIKPDAIPPLTAPGDAPGAYDRLGFRVPLIVVSPWARAGYVSSVVQDLTSLTAFIERKWNLPAMTFRDANAHPMTDYFDFRAPAFACPRGCRQRRRSPRGWRGAMPLASHRLCRRSDPAIYSAVPKPGRGSGRGPSRPGARSV